MSSDNCKKYLPLESFAVGDSIRIFQTSANSGQIYYAQNYDRGEIKNLFGNFFINKNDDLKFKYLMYKKEDYSLNKNLTKNFIEYINESILSSSQKQSLSYFDSDKFEFNNSNNKIFQINNKCYILNNNSYIDEISGNIEKYNQNLPYQLTQFFGNAEDTHIKNIWNNNKNNVNFLEKYKKFKSNESKNIESSLLNEFYSEYSNDLISSYLSSYYSSNFFNDSKNVDNKSIPIYDLNEEAISKLYIIKLFDQLSILNILNKYDLMTISGDVLFNSKIYDYDTKDFDSIAIINVYDYIIKKFSKEKAEEKLNLIFEDIFTNIPKKSFYRLLIPAGQINVLSEENSISKLNEKQEYLYSINLNNDDKDWYSVNYFSLKNMNNPELNYDYSLEKNSDFKSLSPSYFSFDHNIRNKIIKIYQDEVLNKVKNFRNEHDLYFTSATFIYENNIVKDMKEKFLNMYEHIDKNLLNQVYDEQILSSELNNWIYSQGFKLYMYDTYNLNVEKNSISIYKNEMRNLISSCFDNFYVKYNEAKDLFHDKNNIKLFDKIFDVIQFGLEEDNFIGVYDYLDSIDIILERYLQNNEVDQIIKILESLCIINTDNFLDTKIDFENPFYFNKINSIIDNVIDISENFELKDKKEYYLSMFTDLFKHENSMEFKGYLNGIRKYNNCGNTKNDIWLSYNYLILFDKNFIKENNIIINLSSEIDLENYFKNKINICDDFEIPCNSLSDIMNTLKNLELNNECFVSSLLFGASLNLNSLNNETLINLNNLSINNESIIKVKNNLYIVFNENLNYNKEKILNYLKMLKTIRKISFGEYIKGQHYYKKERYSKSNIFSIDVKNSGFNYTLYSFYDVKRIIENEKNKKFDINNKNELLSLIKHINDSNFYKIDFNFSINDTTKKDYVLTEYDDFNKLSFFKEEDKDENKIKEKYELLIVKNKMRKHFESAIRTSIKRYIPANTVLWKIEYSGN